MSEKRFSTIEMQILLNDKRTAETELAISKNEIASLKEQLSRAKEFARSGYKAVICAKDSIFVDEFFNAAWNSSVVKGEK